MSEPARLTSNLLARKGEAAPAGGFAVATIAPGQPLPAAGILTRTAPAPVRATEIERRAVVTLPPPRRRDDRVTLTVRVDRDQHTRLRLFAARRNRSHQDILTRALDAYLEACGADCACVRAATR